MKFLPQLLFLFLITTAAIPSSEHTKADDVIAIYWSPKKDAKIEIYKRGNKYYGKTISADKPGLDTKNPDPALRKRNIVGLEFLKDFVFDGSSEWTGGTVYDPESGKTYSCKMWLENKDLMLKGYIGVSLLGRSEKLERVK